MILFWFFNITHAIAVAFFITSIPMDILADEHTPKEFMSRYESMHKLIFDPLAALSCKTISNEYQVGVHRVRLKAEPPLENSSRCIASMDGCQLRL
jgi:hypothetical protein